MTTHRTTRWNIALVAALLTSGTGVLLAESKLLFLAIPGVVFTIYSHLHSVPNTTLDIEREIKANNPSHGEEVEILVTLRNTGEQTLSNVSIVDGIPLMLSVENGSARHATALGSGEETTFSYTVTAKHGVHCFQPATIVFRDISSSVAVETTITVETKLTCRSPIQTISLGHIAHQHAGSTVATNGLTGIEFSKVRSYRFGDPPNRIDWNRYARDKELTTISFREDRSRAVILCIDARAICYRSSSRTEPHAVFYERAAARELLGTVSRSDEPIGLLVLGPDHYWIAPNTGSHHSTILQRTLDDTDILPLKPPSRNGTKNNVDMQMNSLKTKIAKNTSIILLSPLVDDVPLETAQVLRATGHSVTVLSPDVTTTGSLGTELARLQRTNRINVLRRTPISVIDWNPKTPLETALYSTVNP